MARVAILTQQLVSDNIGVGTTGSHAVLTVAMDRDVNMFYFTLDKSNWMKLMMKIEQNSREGGREQIAVTTGNWTRNAQLNIQNNTNQSETR